MTTRRIFTVIALLAVLLVTRSAHAHKPSDSYLTLQSASRASFDLRWDIALRDLDYAIGLDADGDGAITWGEVRSRADAIDRYALERLAVRSDGAPCPFGAATHAIVEHSDGAYLVLRAPVTCAGEARAIDVAYALFFDLDPQHRGLLHLAGPSLDEARTFAADRRTARIDLGAPARAAPFAEIVGVGIHHIWEGYDHMLFLLALLLPSVLRRVPHGWTPVPRFRPVLGDVLRVVTAFTVAHSLTLSLAALDVVRLPSRVTEAAIAASVVVAAANNLVPVLREDRWLAAFALGLLHGFGFSATLIDLGLPRGSLLSTLLGFNVGVEIGQLAVVAAFLPLAFAARSSVAYRRFALFGGSIAIGALAAVWLVERAFALRILS